MMLEIPHYIRNLQPYVPGKPIEETRREFHLKRVIKLASNENPIGPSPLVLRKLRQDLKDLRFYPDSSGYALKRALAKFYDFPPENIVLGNGSAELIDLAIRTVCRPGDALVTSKTSFFEFKVCAQAHGVRVLESEVKEDLKADLASMADLVRKTPEVRIVCLANPNNPTGTYVSAEELSRFLEEVKGIRGGSTLVLMDYAYGEYVTARDMPDPLDSFTKYPNLLVLRTFSKAYGLAGLRIGYGFAAMDLVVMIDRVRKAFNMNSLALSAAEAALKDQEFVKKARRVNEVGKQYWEKGLKSLGLKYWKSQGNFLLAEVSGSGPGDLTIPEIYQECLKKGVIFRPVHNYGIQRALRISIGSPKENEVGLRVLRSVLQRKGK